MNDCPWSCVCLNYWEEGGSISPVDNLHVSQSWSVGYIHHTKYPHLCCGRPPPVVLHIWVTPHLYLSRFIFIFSTFGLWRNRDSSIWTIAPGPPKIIGIGKSLVVQTSLSHLYTSMAVPSSTSATLPASVTGYCCDHQKIRRSHFCKVSLDFEKKLPSLMDFLVSQSVHRQLTPSEMSFRCLSTITTPHLRVYIIKTNLNFVSIWTLYLPCTVLRPC